MAETIRELVVKYGIDVDADPLDKLDSAISNLKGGLLGLGATLGAAAAGLFGVVKTAADAGDQVLKMSQRVGVGVESLQALMFQAKLADVGVEQLQTSLVFLNRNMTEAGQKGGEMAKAFLKVGISQAELRSGTLTADKALERIGKTFGRLPDGPQKSALAMELFGRSGAQLIPLLNGMEKGLSATQKAILDMNMVTEEQAKLGEEFNDNLTVMQAAFGGIIKSVGKKLLPVMNELVIAFTNFIVENKDLIKTNVTAFVEGLADFLRDAGKFALVAARSMAGLAKSVGGVGNLVKIVLTGLFALSGVSVLMGIGKLVSYVMLLVKGLTMAKLVAFAIPTLIGAAILLVLLVIDDLVAYFQGGDSVTGVIIEKFKEVLAWFQENFPNLSKFVRGVFDAWIAYLNILISFWTGLFNVIAKVAGFMASVFAPVIDRILQGVMAVVNALGTIGSFVGKGLGAGLGFTGELLSRGAQLANPTNPTLPGVSNSSSATAFNVDAPINVVVPPGTDPGSVGPFVREGVAGGLDSSLRQASRSTVSGVAY
jgi:hypothetical protein